MINRTSVTDVESDKLNQKLSIICMVFCSKSSNTVKQSERLIALLSCSARITLIKQVNRHEIKLMTARQKKRILLATMLQINNSLIHRLTRKREPEKHAFHLAKWSHQFATGPSTIKTFILPRPWNLLGPCFLLFGNSVAPYNASMVSFKRF